MAHTGNRPQRQGMHELQLRLQKIERRFENLERHGTISDTKYDKDKKRWYVKFNDGEDQEPTSDKGDDKESDTFKTGWRPWKSFSNGAISFSVPPKKGQKVTLRSPGGYPEQGYVESYHYGPETPSPHDKEDEVVMQIVKPKKKDDQSSPSQSGSSSSSSSSSDATSNSSDDDDTALRISTKKDGYVLTVGKLGESKDASHSDGDGKSEGEKNTFQMSIGRDAKTITCGKFKGVIGKDGTKLTWGDKVAFELKDGQIEATVDGAKHTITKTGIVTDVDGTKLKTTSGGSTFENGTVKHDDRNIGKNHIHGQVMPGGGKTGDPDP